MDKKIQDLSVLSVNVENASGCEEAETGAGPGGPKTGREGQAVICVRVSFACIVSTEHILHIYVYINNIIDIVAFGTVVCRFSEN